MSSFNTRLIRAASNRTSRTSRTAAGSTLLEVLIAIVVLSIGLLGLANLQATSLKSNQGAYLRSQATLLAYDLGDQMRASRAATLAGNFDNTSSEPERNNWNTAIVAALGPGASGAVGRTDCLVSITVTWDDNRGRIRTGTAADVANQTFVYQTEVCT